ncbi:hypothetical protein JEQ12_010212, partial [Ovis aries]
IEKFQGSDGKNEDEEEKYLDVISNKNIKLSERVLIPVKQYPKFNFVGKLLGPRGNSLKRLQEETGAKMSILGKGSMRDKAKEEELRKSGEAKYAHLSDELHVLIEVFAPPGEAYSRMSHALEEIKKFLVPDIRQPEKQTIVFKNSLGFYRFYGRLNFRCPHPCGKALLTHISTGGPPTLANTFGSNCYDNVFGNQSIHVSVESVFSNSYFSLI